MTLKAKKMTNRHRCPEENCQARKRSKTPKTAQKVTCLPPIGNKENVDVPTNTPVNRSEELHFPNIRVRADRLIGSMILQEDNNTNIADKTNEVFFLPSVNGQTQRNTTSNVTPSFRRQPLQLASHGKRFDDRDKFSNVLGK